MIQNIYDAINPVLTSMGYEIVDIEKSSVRSETVLTVYVDKVPGGISLDDCEKINGAVEQIIDDLDPNSGKSYILEISSPGLDRPFKTQRDFERNYGKEVEVKLYAPLMGKKLYEGVLIEKAEGFVVINSDGVERKIEMNKIAVVRPLVKFE